MKTFKEFHSQPECNTGFGGAPDSVAPTMGPCAERRAGCDDAEEELLEDSGCEMVMANLLDGTLRSRG